MRLFDLSGQVALITGSTRGIGLATAHAMAEAGAKVVVSSRKAEICETVAGDIATKGGEAIAIPANISEDDALDGLVAKTLSHWGGSTAWSATRR